VVKLSSNDASWWSFTALRYHYMTQPLPTWVSWYFAQAPNWFQAFSCGVVFFAELIVPFLIFGPRRVRILAFWALVVFQLLIAGTGNYGFFNILAIVLCCLLPDDAFWRWILRRKQPRPQAAPTPKWRGLITIPLAVLLLSISVPICIAAFRVEIPWPSPVLRLRQWIGPFQIVNSYGLFASMTTTRPELIIEGSDDGENWKEYGFEWKMGALNRRPEFTTPHMPRLDWQMWFAALYAQEGDSADNQWLPMFMQRLLEGSPPVLKLLETNPFPDHPPRLMRAVLYDYKFTDFAERRRTGDWWKRSEIGEYFELSR
jgi:lipase maturation factor 1